jgi:hypothetical protein
MANLRIWRLLLAGALIAGWNSNGYSASAAHRDLGAGIALQMMNGRPIIGGVMVNGHGPYRFVIDTGSNVDLIESGLAASIGLVANYKSELSSASGSAAVVGSAENTIAIEGSTAANHQLLILSDLTSVHRLSRDIRGVLGQAFLSNFDYLLDLRNKRIEFGKRDWQGTRVSFRVLNARPVVPTRLGDLVLDSGTAYLVLFRAAAEISAGAKSEYQTLAGSEEVQMISTGPLNIGGRTFESGEAVAVPSRTEPGIDGLLPAGLFKSVFVCNSEGYITLN